jgi:predicted small secreted protein
MKVIITILFLATLLSASAQSTQSAGKDIRKGANTVIGGIVVGSLFASASVLVKNPTASKVVLYTGLGITAIVPLIGIKRIAIGGGKLEGL